ncbi:MAG TPA: XRE family transcriptional regulator [Stellaceae bacterium]|nr:XRE family transcriptional regulator [Stellaceae bacterium]
MARQLPYNPTMMRWAREWRGRNLEDSAKKAGISVEKLAEWEAGSSVPTIRQARQLAAFYDRRFMEFFYDSPPEIKSPDVVPDFRLYVGADEVANYREIQEIHRWAEAQRLNALGLLSEIGEAPPAVSPILKATTADDVEAISFKIRQEMGLSVEDQRRLPLDKIVEFPRFLRRRMDGLGILVLRRTDLGEYGVRGICVVKQPLPIIVFGNESPHAQAFTLIHELAHVILKQSAISDHDEEWHPQTAGRLTERWCNRFASAFLIPKAALVEVFGAIPQTPTPLISDNRLTTLARAFNVSEHAMLVRLVQLGYVGEQYYFGHKLPRFRKAEAEFESKGRSTYWASRKVSALGEFYTGLVLEAWGTDRIQYHEAAGYMGLKNPSHLEKIREEFTSS